MDPRDEELLNRELDGEATPEEVVELRRLVALRPELRARYEGLRALVRALERVKDGEVPEDLRGDVLRRIAARPVPAAPRPGWRAALGAALSRQPAFRFAFVFAGGLALGILASALAVRLAPSADVAMLAGTMLPESRLARLEPASRERLELGDAKGEAATRAARGRVLAEVDLDSSAAVTLTLEFDPAALTPLVFRQDGAGRDVVLDSRGLRLSHLGHGRYSLLFEVKATTPAPLRLRLVSGAGLLERTLTAGGAGS
jgi:anti-sigma factor RsiW